MIEIGKRYTVPSGLGGSFDVIALGFLPEGTKVISGNTERTLPKRVSVRVDMPRNRDWHGWLTEYDQAYFEDTARPL